LQTVEIGPVADLFLFRFLIIFLRQRGKRGRLRGSGRGRREGSERRMAFQQPPMSEAEVYHGIRDVITGNHVNRTERLLAVC
jgi:hypothetical protein